MSRLFPDEDNFKGEFAPTRIEAEIRDCEVEGEIPSALNSGAFIRVQPDPAYPPTVKDDIFFNGDGLVGAFRFENGRAHYQSRYAMTEKLKVERAAGQALFGAYRNPFSDDESVRHIRRTNSNTNVVVHGGLLLAMEEDAPPTAMDPHTLETIGVHRFNGAMTGDTFTAHPKLDPVSGELIAFGYEARGLGSPDIVYYVISPEGALLREVWIKAPHASMVHDWGVTQHYVVFPIMPLVSSVERMKAGKSRFTYRKDLDQYYGVMRRDGDGSDLRWFRLPNGFQAHAFNAFDDGGKVYLDMTVASDNVFAFFPDENGHAPHPMTINVPVTRIIFDMRSKSGGVEAEPLTNPAIIAGDFPHCDDRYTTLPYRHVFMTSLDPSKDYDYDRLGPPSGMFFNGIGRLDVSTRTATRWWAGPTSSAQEPVFAPRSAEAPEADGYVMTVVNRLAEGRSDLVILDSADMAAGPVATVKLPFRLRTALHGNWIPAAALRHKPLQH